MSEGWGERLSTYFEELRATRTSTGAPVFALEHGLNPAEFKSLTAYLHRQVNDRAAFLPDWLSWVVYGAELGYIFNGQDYWSTFEARTPNWAINGYKRDWLRDVFKRFHRRYQGFQPRGAWATHFSIIAWPITHAILPKDLQTQLAHTLYRLRYHIVERLEQDPTSLGRYIGERGEGSSRFRNFLQQEEMVGRLALALLGGSKQAWNETISPATLERIVLDLEKRQSAKVWLDGARKEVERARIKGLGHFGSFASPSQVASSPQAEKQNPYLRPSIVLQRADSNEWIATAHVPSYGPLIERSPDLGRYLRTTRCGVEGADGYRPAGWLVSGSQHRVLKSWPDPARPLVRFEKPNATIERLLETDARMSPGPLWFFEIGADGQARERAAGSLQAGRRYIIVCRDSLPSVPFSSEARVRCSNCHASMLELPKHISGEDYSILRRAGIYVARVVSVWPAGLTPRRWDGQGRADWFVGEIPSFGISADHDVEVVNVSLNGVEMTAVPPVKAGKPAFLSLPGLSQGTHHLAVNAKVRNEEGSALWSKVAIEVGIEPPVAWIAGESGFKGMVPLVEPLEPTLDDFFEGRIDLSVLGPAAYGVKIALELLDAGNGDLATEVVMEASLPCTVDSWRRHCAAFIKNWASPWAFLSATGGNLAITNDELGTHRIPLRRDVRPVRFIWLTKDKATQVRLLDEHRGGDPVTAAFYSFNNPCDAALLGNQKLLEGFEPATPGGLFSLQHGKVTENLVVSMPQVTSLADLAPGPQERGFPTGADALRDTQAHLGRWRSATLAGPLAHLRRELIVRRLEQHLFRLLCGETWWRAERSYEQSAKSARDLKAFAAKTETKPSFSVLLGRDLVELRALDYQSRVNRLADIAVRYDVSNVPTSRAAMAIAASVESGHEIDAKSLEILTALGKAGQPVLRAARFVSIAQAASDQIDARVAS
ncbi:conserved hypothetical protein [Agrobacterium fabacearum CFBP 5771]|uniref:hypothetical protein n=1 Tax=Agrobacterium tumefaciens TaxID=358 RepID=UPI0009BB0136|nr:hypothetical protein [Agrobacterium tumefaciens]CVI23678.1 conserved hypothetical protein [Agrobacterium fabacearum CFBP 5771]